MIPFFFASFNPSSGLIALICCMIFARSFLFNTVADDVVFFAVATFTVSAITGTAGFFYFSHIKKWTSKTGSPWLLLYEIGFTPLWSILTDFR